MPIDDGLLRRLRAMPEDRIVAELNWPVVRKLPPRSPMPSPRTKIRGLCCISYRKASSVAFVKEVRGPLDSASWGSGAEVGEEPEE